MVDESAPTPRGEPRAEPFVISKVHDELWVTWQHAPAGATLGGGYVVDVVDESDVLTFTYSGMLINGLIHNVEPISNTTWTSIPEDWYDHKGNYVLNGSSESTPEYDALYDVWVSGDKYSFEWTAIEDSVAFCWFTRGHEPNLNYNIEYIKLDGSMEITNNQVLAVVSGEVNFSLGGSSYPLRQMEFVRRKDNPYTVSSTDGNAIISVVTLS